MNVANLDLCKELYELSGWKATEKYHYIAGTYTDIDTVAFRGRKYDGVPAYDLGYLLRKLPKGFAVCYWG